MTGLRHETIRRLPVFSLITAMVAAAVLVTNAVLDTDLPATGQGALGLVVLSSAIADAIRLGQLGSDKSRSGEGGKGRAGSSDSSGKNTEVTDEELRQWIEHQSETLQIQSKQLADRAMALQQWMQFPDAISFRPQADRERLVPKSSDPLQSHDKALVALIDAKTHELFDSIKNDTYREKTDEGYVFKTDKIRDDLFLLVSDVAAIYRPGDPAPLLRTNVEAISRAAGRASLRLLVAVESLPVSLATYDFQSIYKLVTQAVKTFGLYKSAKPYLDIASTMWLAGRIVVSTNPITMAAWWAASKATTYGASKLGQHVLDQQAVGLIRLLVEIVAVEVASIYSPMVRYRDIHWVYGVELVHLASRLNLSDTARMEAMRQLAVLNFKDEYGRVSLMRQLANKASSRPDQYHPSASLSLADRTVVAEKLEEFLLAHVLNGAKAPRNQADAIEQWQHDTSARLEIQFRAESVQGDENELRQRAVWALAAFALEHLGDEPAVLEKTLTPTKCWQQVHLDTQQKYLGQLVEDPPFLYHPPEIVPGSELATMFQEDLSAIAAGLRVPSASETPVRLTPGESIELPKQTKESVLRVTAYFLRSDPEAIVAQYRKQLSNNLIARSAPPSVIDAVVSICQWFAIERPHALFCSGKWTAAPQAKLAANDAVCVLRLKGELVCFSIEETPACWMLHVHSVCPWSDATFSKQSGYIRSDCQVTFADKSQVALPGPTFGSYEDWFKPLVESIVT